MEDQKARLYVNAARQILMFSVTPILSDCDSAISSLERTIYVLKSIGIPHLEQDLVRLKEKTEKARSEKPAEFESGIPESLRTEWAVIAQAVENVFDAFCDTRTLAVLDRSAVSDALREYQTSHLEEHEELILKECIRCLETGAYRAAIVMGWELVYEHVRQWLFQSKARLATFNKELTSRNRSASQKYDPIVTYEEVTLLGEHFCLEIAYAAKLLSKQHHQILQSGLTDRNHFAHPSMRKITVHSAVGYVDNLVVNVLSAKEFARRTNSRKARGIKKASSK